MWKKLFRNNTEKHKIVDSLNEKRLLKSISSIQNDFNRYRSYSNQSNYSDQILNELGGDYTKLARLLDDSHVYSVVQSRKSASLSMAHKLNMTDVNPEIANFIEKVFSEYDIPLENEKLLDAVLYGWIPIELNWKIGVDKWTISSFIQHPHSWFEIDNNNLVYFKPNNYIGSKSLVSPDKLIIVSNNMNKYGNSILTKCYYPVKFKDAALEYWVKYAEKFGSPLWHAEVPNSLDDDTMIEIETELKKARESGILITKAQMKLGLINAASQSTINVYNNLIGLCNVEISKSVLSQTLTTEIGNVGSYAASQTHKEIMDYLVKSDLRIIESFWNKIIKLLVSKNFILDSQEKLPKLDMLPVPKASIDEANKIAILSNTGVKFNKKFYENNFNLNSDEFDIKEIESEVPSSLPMNMNDETDYVTKEINNAFEEIQDVINSWDGKTEINGLIDNMIDSVQKLIKSGKSFKAIQNKVVSFMDNEELAETFAEKMGNMYFNSFIYGVTNGEKHL